MGDKAIVVTLKRGKGYDDPWLVVHADSVAEAKAHIEDALGVDAGTYEGVPLLSVIGSAAKSFQAPGLVENILGGAEIGLGAGKPVESKVGGGSEDPKPAAKKRPPAKKEAEAKQEAPAEKKAQEPPWDDSDPVLEDISKATSPTSLRRVWARHKAVWDKEKHGAALEARKKELAA